MALDRAAQAVVVSQRGRGESPVVAAQADLRRGWRLSVRLDEEDNMPRWRALPVPQLGLVEMGGAGVLPGRGWALLLWAAGGIQLTALRALGAPPGRGAVGGHVQR